MRRPRVLVLCAALLVGAACKADPPKTEQVLVWQPVATWTGEGGTQTESFPSQTGTFKFTWESKSVGTTPGHLRITLHSAVSGRPLIEAVDHTGDGKDAIFVSEDPREFYVVVAAEHTKWRLTVDEGISLLLTPTRR
ncbi:MAG: hypothetical protein ABL961_14880 [Vicinamibacterales bacterium]